MYFLFTFFKYQDKSDHNYKKFKLPSNTRHHYIFPPTYRYIVSPKIDLYFGDATQEVFQ